MPKPKVLFICLGNSCRSIMAEALTRHRCGECWEAYSAGINPLGWVAPETLTVLGELGVDTAGLRSKGLDEFDLAEFQLLVNLSGHSLPGRISPPPADRLIHEPVLDPFGGSLERYRQSREAIDALIRRELCGAEPLPPELPAA
ncbi:MAG: hypothetical protein WC443_01865 [Desulfobaccales bacterium]